METIWLEDFLALASELNFSRAAERRHITQPAFSRRIRALESWVGAPLFTRTTHNVAMTAAGAVFHAQAAMLSRDIQRLRQETRAAAGIDAGVLTIAATHALSFTFFPRWIRGNDALFGRGNLNLVSDSMMACEEIMLRGEASLMLCHHHPAMRSQFEPGQFDSVRVGSDSLVLVSAPDAEGKPIWSLDAGRPAPYLGYSEPSGLGRIIAAVWRKERSAGRIEQVFTSHLAATLLTMARSGEGLAWLPMTLAEDSLEAGTLVRVASGAMPIPIEIRLYRHKGRQGATIEAAWAALP